MLRVGYPATLNAELLRDFPAEVELIPLPDNLDHEIDIDVWLPDPYAKRAMRIWPWLRGVRLIVALMAGTEWIPGLAGPHVTILNARGAHNISTAEWTVSAILATLKYFPFYLDLQRAGQWKRRFEASARYARIAGDARPIYPPVLLEELTGKSVLMAGYGAIGKEIERMLALPCQANARGPHRARKSNSSRRCRTRQPVAASGNCNSYPSLDGRIASSHRPQPTDAHAAGRTAGERRARSHR